MITDLLTGLKVVTVCLANHLPAITEERNEPKLGSATTPLAPARPAPNDLAVLDAVTCSGVGGS